MASDVIHMPLGKQLFVSTPVLCKPVTVRVKLLLGHHALTFITTRAL